MNDIEVWLVVALVLFVFAGVMRLKVRAWDAAIALGLAAFTLAHLVNP